MRNRYCCLIQCPQRTRLIPFRSIQSMGLNKIRAHDQQFPLCVHEKLHPFSTFQSGHISSGLALACRWLRFAFLFSKDFVCPNDLKIVSQKCQKPFEFGVCIIHFSTYKHKLNSNCYCHCHVLSIPVSSALSVGPWLFCMQVM